MFHDKSLVCRDCGNEFIFPLRNKRSLPRKGLPTSRAAVSNAERSVNGETVIRVLNHGQHGNCMPPSVPLAAQQQRFRSYPAAIVRSTAGIATPNAATVHKAITNSFTVVKEFVAVSPINTPFQN